MHNLASIKIQCMMFCATVCINIIQQQQWKTSKWGEGKKINSKSAYQKFNYIWFRIPCSLHKGTYTHNVHTNTYTQVYLHSYGRME